MENNIVRITRPPEPTTHNPYAQLIWIFFKVEREQNEPYAANFRYAKNKYLEYVAQTNAGYAELAVDPRFFLNLYWEADALIRFNQWLEKQILASKTRYGLYKAVRRVMDVAYSTLVIAANVYHAPMHKGVRETDSRASYTEEQQEVITAAIARWSNVARSVLNGYTRTNQGIPYRKKNTLGPVAVDGVQYEPAEAARRFGVPRGELQKRLKSGWSAREALDLEPRRQASPGMPIQLIVEGVTYPSVTQAAEAYGVRRSVVSNRLLKGHTPEQAVGLVPVYVHQSDERALLWSFENEYQCDPLAMLNDFRRRKWSVVATDARLRTLFSRWGVWPYVDDRLVMPLAAELCMLTGLNVESLKKLEVDCYQAEHALTGKAVITFLKKRASSPSRPEEQSLHLSLLEVGKAESDEFDVEEKFVDERVVAKVERLIALILAITAPIREHAPIALQKRLFIFQDIEASRLLGSTIIVGIDPKGKASTWYDRFAKEEGLKQSFGPEFKFNLARWRPTLVTNLVLAGADVFQVQTAICHASVTTTVSYLDEHRLQPVFNETVTGALENITRRSIEHHTQKGRKHTGGESSLDAFHETLSGCGCRDPYSPSELVRKVTRHKEGRVCRNWNMCLFCDEAVVTENSLPKIIVYRGRVSVALENASPALEPRRKLLEDVAKLIDGVLEEDAIFPKQVLDEARIKAVNLDDILVDQLIYQGI
ncbi:hypothetical protein J2X16_001675 [Pelomonas aquatica]|uniref:Tyr recombinase domain-containing protein n=1 Tax=Pelomonas aquatica TaxID=431058 RepID=A0ABU1Z6T3_9BURK|nr:hypothetical protein [Pelomonas aquatica]MDR7296336.1 hypothetical protein [Pelomonas aquatica]